MEKKEIQLAKLFHDTYERLAPEFGYTTREDTKEFNKNSPNGKLMVAVCKEVMTQELDRVREEGKITEDTSDGYHTFKELYEYRKLYNAGMFNLLPKSFNVHKSKRHSDGKLCFGGNWFIVMATLPTGQISNHYELKDWDLFKCEEREKADEWDGHTPEDVARRIKDYLN